MDLQSPGLYSVESRPSVPGSPAVPAYYSRESSRTARSLVHSVPGAVGCGNPPALSLLLSPSRALSPPLLSALSSFDSRFLSLSPTTFFFLSLSLSRTHARTHSFSLSYALRGYSLSVAHTRRDRFTPNMSRRNARRLGVDGKNEPRTIEWKRR